MERDGARGTSLEQITEDDELLLEDANESPLKAVKVQDIDFPESAARSGLEPDQNYSAMQNSEAYNEEWITEAFVDLDLEIGVPLIGFCFLSTRMVCIFENF